MGLGHGPQALEAVVGRFGSIRVEEVGHHLVDEGAELGVDAGLRPHPQDVLVEVAQGAVVVGLELAG